MPTPHIGRKTNGQIQKQKQAAAGPHRGTVRRAARVHAGDRDGRHGRHRRVRLAGLERDLHRQLRLRRSQGVPGRRLRELQLAHAGQVRDRPGQEPRPVPLRRRQQRRERGRLLRRQGEGLRRPGRARARLGKLSERPVGQFRLGAPVRPARPHAHRRMADGVRAGQRHQANPVRRESQLRTLGCPVRQQRADRLPEPTVELLDLRRGHAPVHLQRLGQRLQRAARPQLLPRRRRPVAGLRQPRRRRPRRPRPRPSTYRPSRPPPSVATTATASSDATRSARTTTRSWRSSTNASPAPRP